MSPHESQRVSTTEGLPLAPSLAPSLELAHVRSHATPVDRRVVVISGLAILVATAAAFAAQLLTALIGLCTNLAFYGQLSTRFRSPAEHQLGAWVVLVPVLGGLIVGLMARYGSKAIRGHGIPEAMEQVLTNQSRIPPRMTLLKPLSAAISIGTGGPFGAEGPIIATGGALGSLLGQLVRMTAVERKTLLASGAAAGMAATFGSPISAVVLAVELLLFEYRPRSLVPVALAASTASALRVAFVGATPAFAMPTLAEPSGPAFVSYVLLGALVGAASVLITRAVYAVEDAFEKLPISWPWWPALGGLCVGVVGLFAPRTMGVGYDNIDQILSGQLTVSAVAFLCGLKFISWSVSLGSGTSGGTLAPLFTLGGGLGTLLGAVFVAFWPHAAVDPRMAALVGMAAMFAGASRALLASVVFAFEVTRQASGLLPLLAGSAAGYLVSSLLMRNSIMTEKIVRRGVRVLAEYSADFLDQVSVGQIATRDVSTLSASDTVKSALAFLDSGNAGSHHQGFPVLDADKRLVGVITRKDLYAARESSQSIQDRLRRACVAIHDDCSLRDAADTMARERIGRLPVIEHAAPHRLVGIVTRSDLVNAHATRLEQQRASRARSRLASPAG